MSTPLCASCFQPLPPRRPRGPEARYCSSRCRQSVFRQRRLAAALEPAFAEPREVRRSPAGPVGSLDEVAMAIAEARSIAGAFIRLGRQAHPTFAWRCTKVGVALRDTLDRQFPELL